MQSLSLNANAWVLTCLFKLRQILLKWVFEGSQHSIAKIGYWLWCIILLIILWIWSANTLLKSFASLFTRDIDLYFSFLVMSLSGLGRGNTGFIESIWKYSLCPYLLKDIVERWHNFFLKCLVAFIGELIWTWHFRRLSIIDSISLFYMGLFRSLICSLSLGGFCLSENWFILSRLLNLWA